MHHPIYNPIDFKIDHDNKYILRELQDEEEFEKKLQMSSLAKSGSNAILSHQ